MKKTLIFLSLVIVVQTNCRKESADTDGRIVIAGVLTDSLTNKPVANANVQRMIHYESICWGISSLDICWVWRATHNAITDSLGRFFLSIPKDSIQGGATLWVGRSSFTPAHIEFKGGQELFGFDLGKDTVVHNMKVRVDVRQRIVVRVEDNPDMNFLPPDVKWRCLPRFFVFSGSTKIISFADDLTEENTTDTLFAPDFSLKAYVSWTFRPKTGNQVLHPGGMDSLLLTTDVFNEYVIYY
jgi:hypothetical protein